MKQILEWIAGNLVILAIGACAAAGAFAVILPIKLLGLPEEYWPWVSLPASLATVAGGIYGCRFVFWLIGLLDRFDR